MKRTALADICVLVTDGTHYTPPPSPDGVPFLTVKDMQNGRLNFDSSGRISLTEFERARAGNSAPSTGDVLFSKDGTVGKVHVVADARDFAVLSSIAILRPDRQVVDADYLGHALRAPVVVRQAMRSRTGTAIRRVILSDLAQLRIPLPPLDEQRQIARVLNVADQLGASRRQTAILIQELAASRFIELFGDPRNNSHAFPVGSIGDIVESTDYGSSQKAGTEGRYPILRMGNLTVDGRVDLVDLKYVDLDKHVDRYLVRPGDVLFNRTNSPDLVGKTAVYRGPEPMVYAGYLIRLRMANGHSAEYLAGFMNSRYGKRLLRRMAKSIIGMANINAREVRAIRLPIPPCPATRVHVVGGLAPSSGANACAPHAEPRRPVRFPPAPRVHRNPLTDAIIGRRRAAPAVELHVPEGSWPELAAEAMKAERSAAADPRTACFYARRALELAVHWLYDADRPLSRPYKDDLSAMVFEPSFQAAVDQRIWTKMDFIRRAGKPGGARPQPDQGRRPRSARCSELFHVMFWLARTYARDPDGRAARKPRLQRRRRSRGRRRPNSGKPRSRRYARAEG